MFKSKYFTIFISCILLSGCTAESGGESSSLPAGTTFSAASESVSAAAPAAPAASAASPVSGTIDGTIPVIDIVTKDTDSDVMSFVTKPITRYVAKSIASWTPGFKVPAEPYYEACSITLTDTDNTVLIDCADADVKVRGNWTTAYDKKPLRIKFSEKQNMLGLNGGNEFKNWLLLAEYKDFSMLRNKTAFQLADELLGGDGCYSADSEFVEVRINGEYWGVYLLTEQQEVNKGRVDIKKPEKDYTGTDIGYLLEYDGYYNNEEPLYSFRVNYRHNAPLTPYDGKGGSGKTALPFSNGKNDVGFTIKSEIYSKEQHDTVAKYVNNVYDIMYEAAYSDKAFVMTDDLSEIVESTDLTPREAVEKVVNVQSLVDSYILAELTCDADLYWSSFFMDVDLSENGDGRLTFEAPWDFDSALGNKDRCADGTGYYASNLIPDVNGMWKEMDNPWTIVLANEDWFRESVRERWTAFYDSGAFDRAYEMISSDSEKYEAAFTRNYEKWDNIRYNDAAGELCRAAAACKSEKEAADYLQSWLKSRVDFLNSEWHN